MRELAKCRFCKKDDYDHMWRKTGHRFKCPRCGGDRKHVINYSMMWHDGDVICSDCRLWIRSFDAG